MRVLAIDHGDRRFGLAVSDPTGSIAFPFEVLEGEETVLARAAEILADREIERIVVGLPLNMDGSTGPKARQVLAFRDRLAARVAVPVDVWDERLTTVEAERLLREAGGSPRKRRARLDAVAAQVLLQSYLDARGGGAADATHER